jgi:hypothetical protein
MILGSCPRCWSQVCNHHQQRPSCCSFPTQPRCRRCSFCCCRCLFCCAFLLSYLHHFCACFINISRLNVFHFALSSAIVPADA